MIKKKKVLFLENLPYKSNINVGSHHYANLFSNEYDVLWISLPWHFAQLLKDRKSDRFRNWNWNKVQRINKNLKTFTPFIPLPFRDLPILRSSWFVNNLVLFIPGIKNILKQEEFLDPDLVWFTDPRHISVLKYITAKKIVYRCVDNLEHFSDVPITLLNVEKKLIENSFCTFFTSKDLINKFQDINVSSYYLPNGCDFVFFSSKIRLALKVQIEKYFNKSKVNVLYMGAVAEWFDFDALDKIAENNNLNFVIVGPIRTSIPNNIRNRGNVIFTGPKPYEMMPAFVQLANIGIIPFKINEMTNSVNPIKLYEYCAGGIPVISANFKTISDMNGPFFKYSNVTELNDLLNKMTEDLYGIYSKDVIQQFAKNNSWENRYEYVKKIIVL